jgi:hypothetical protein
MKMRKIKLVVVILCGVVGSLNYASDAPKSISLYITNPNMDKVTGEHSIGIHYMFEIIEGATIRGDLDSAIKRAWRIAPEKSLGLSSVPPHDATNDQKKFIDLDYNRNCTFTADDIKSMPSVMYIQEINSSAAASATGTVASAKDAKEVTELGVLFNKLGK